MALTKNDIKKREDEQNKRRSTCREETNSLVKYIRKKPSSIEEKISEIDKRLTIIHDILIKIYKKTNTKCAICQYHEQRTDEISVLIKKLQNMPN